MNTKSTNIEKFLRAKNKVVKLKGFYIHLCAYIVVFCLLVYNYIIIEENEYMNSIIWLNISIMVFWGIVIILQGWTTFKGGILFGKKWEERKIQKYLETEKKMWE
jgi:hypothetical protein